KRRFVATRLPGSALSFFESGCAPSHHSCRRPYTRPKPFASSSVPSMESDFAADHSAPAVSLAIQALLDRRGVPKSKRLIVLESALGIAYQQVRRRMMGETAWSVDDIKRIAAHFGEPVFRLLGAMVDGEAGQPAVLQVGGTKLACSIWPAAQ